MTFESQFQIVANDQRGNCIAEEHMNTDIEQLNPKNYSEQQVHDQLAYYENAANKAKRKYP